jgi:hypothetical protein
MGLYLCQKTNLPDLAPELYFHIRDVVLPEAIAFNSGYGALAFNTQGMFKSYYEASLNQLKVYARIFYIETTAECAEAVRAATEERGWQLMAGPIPRNEASYNAAVNVAKVFFPWLVPKTPEKEKATVDPLQYNDLEALLRAFLDNVLETPYLGDIDEKDPMKTMHTIFDPFGPFGSFHLVYAAALIKGWTDAHPIESNLIYVPIMGQGYGSGGKAGPARPI